VHSWIKRFNAEHPFGLCDHESSGPLPRFTDEIKYMISRMIQSDFSQGGTWLLFRTMSMLMLAVPRK
jgi:hypothetical protein